MSASAQVHLGVLGGTNLASLNVDPERGIDLSNRIAFGFGAVLGFELNEYLALQLEPMYLQKGTDFVSDGVDFNVKLVYLELPVMFKYSIGTNSSKPYLMAGPTIGYNMSAKAKQSLNGFSSEVDIKDDIMRVDFGLGFGAGLSLAMGGNSIFFEARYALGLMNINGDPGISEDTTFKTKGIQLFTGITFPLAGK